jgi:hypothetical protein
MKKLKKLKNNSDLLLLLILISFFLKEVVWAVVVPIWHTPDEQAHFAQVAYYGEFNKMPSGGFDLNKEIFISEQLLGTDRDQSGNNKFTYHPEYKIPYTNSLNGVYENQINNLPKSNRTQMVKYESANYPPLYYWVAAVPYKIFYSADLITRVYSSRFISILLGLGTVYIAYLIGQLLFPESEVLALSLAALIAFQPMFSFVSAGVNSDNLFNLLFSVIIYYCLKIIKFGLNRKVILETVISLVLLYLTKPQFILSLPLIAGAVVVAFLLNQKVSRKNKIISLLGLLVLAVLMFGLSRVGIVYSFFGKLYPQQFDPGVAKYSVSLPAFLKETLTRTIHETIPWFWGVYDWLGVVLPLPVLRILNRLLIISGLGILVGFIRMIWSRKINIEFLFLLFSVFAYFFGIIYFNYLFFIAHNYSFGIQGRYFFPVIVPLMAVILMSFIFFIPEKFSYLKVWVGKVLVVLMIILNIFSTWLVAHAYYDLSSWNSFITQVSQYKPGIFKGGWIILWLMIYGIGLLLFLLKYFFQDRGDIIHLRSFKLRIHR